MEHEGTSNAYDAIIIGSGLGGLTAGASLAKAGYRILILEQHYLPGGCTTTYNRKGFKVEVGLHEMDGLDPLDPKVKIFRELGIFDHIDLIRLPEFYRVKGRNFDLTLPHDIDGAKEILRNAFPHENKAIGKFFKTITRLRREALKFMELGWKATLLMPVMPLLLPCLVRNQNRTFGSFLDSITKNEDLKMILAANLGYYHHDPYSLSLVYFSLAQASFFCGGGYYIKGGSQTLSDYLVRCIEDSQGRVALRSEVTQIKIDADRATGVFYQQRDGNQNVEKYVSAKTVIANTAIPNLPELLPAKFASRLKRRIGRMVHSCSLMPIYLCFKEPVKRLGHHNYATFLLPDRIGGLGDLKAEAFQPNEERSFVFVDYSQIDSGLAPKGKSFGTICTVDFMEAWETLSPKDYEKQKTQITEHFLKRLEALIPGVRDSIEHLEAGTPKTIQHYTRNPGGSVYGFAQLQGQAGRRRFNNSIGIKNLYYASAWTFPGGGFTGAIIAGSLCADRIKRKYPPTGKSPGTPSA